MTNIKQKSHLIIVLIAFSVLTINVVSCGDSEVRDDLSDVENNDNSGKNSENDKNVIDPLFLATLEGCWTIDYSNVHSIQKVFSNWLSNTKLTFSENNIYTEHSKGSTIHHKWSVYKTIDNNEGLVYLDDLLVRIQFLMRSDGLLRAFVYYPAEATSEEMVKASGGAYFNWKKYDDNNNGTDEKDDEIFSENISTGTSIDLGLSVKWLSCNIGSSKPEDAGDYVCWGDPTGSKEWNQTTAPQQYVNQTSISGTKYDYAFVKSNGKWRMPTKAEAEELLDKCTWACMNYKNIKGFKIIGPNKNSIFLPCVGSIRPYKSNVTGRYKYDQISGKSVAYYHIGEQYNTTTSYMINFASGIYDSNWVWSGKSDYQIITYVSKYERLPIRPVENK